MSIEFKEVDPFKVQTKVFKHDLLVGTIYQLIPRKVHIIYDQCFVGELTADDTETILSKMKELQSEVKK